MTRLQRRQIDAQGRSRGEYIGAGIHLVNKRPRRCQHTHADQSAGGNIKEIAAPDRYPGGESANAILCNHERENAPSSPSAPPNVCDIIVRHSVPPGQITKIIRAKRANFREPQGNSDFTARGQDSSWINLCRTVTLLAMSAFRRKRTLAVVRYPAAFLEFIWTRSNRQRMHGSHHRARQSRRARGRRDQYVRRLPYRP